jgi:AcrR family transcriptional regulator
MNIARTYTMGARAESVAETRQRIIEATFELGTDKVFPDITLDDIARAAGVSVQTVLRQFGSRAELINITTEYAITKVTEERRVPVGDVDVAMRVLLDHYEQRGATALLMLSQENRDPQVAKITELGRRMHRDWVERVFQTQAAGDPGLLDLLVVATDVYTWRLLRHDRKHSRAATERLMKRLVKALVCHSDD